MNRVAQGFQGIAPETRLRLKLLQAVLDMPLNKMLDMMVSDLWDKHRDKVAAQVPQRALNKLAGKLLLKLGDKDSPGDK